MQENDDQKDSEYGHFSRSVYSLLNYFLQGSVAVNNYKRKTYLKYSIFKPYLFIYPLFNVDINGKITYPHNLVIYLQIYM